MNDGGGYLEAVWLWIVTHPWLSLGIFAATSAGVVAGMVMR